MSPTPREPFRPRSYAGSAGNAHGARRVRDGDGADQDQGLTQRYMWVWMDNRLRVQRGTDHGKDMAWEDQNAEAYYRGWFDPATRELFLVGPSPATGRPVSPPPPRGVPRLLDRLLRRRFGEELIYRIF